MVHQVSGNEDIMNRIVKYPFEELKDCGKIKFNSRNNLTFSM